MTTNEEVAAAVEQESIRERIANVATQLFASQGYAATSIRDIAHNAGVTNPTIYYHFGSKAELHQTLLHDAADRFADEVQGAINSATSVRDALISIVDAHFRAVEADPNRFRMFLSAAYVHQIVPIADDTTAVMQRIHESMDDLLQRARHERLIAPEHDAQLVRVVFGGIIINPILSLLGGRCEKHSPLSASALVDLFLRGVAPRASQPGEGI